MPAELQEAVIEQLGKGSKNYKRALQVGFFATETSKGIDVVDLCYFQGKHPHLFEYMLKQAECDKSNTHFVKGCTDTDGSRHARESRDEFFADRTLDNVDGDSATHKKKYRGKHRSHTSGAGIRALVRDGWKKCYNGIRKN